jgi:hypothetical protein
MQEFDEWSYDMIFRRTCHEYFQSIAKYPKQQIKVESLDLYWKDIQYSSVAQELKLIDQYE